MNMLQENKKEKVALIAHSFHKKTKSHIFLVDYLEDFFNVEVFFDDEWETGQKFDWTKFNNLDFKAVIIWQMFPKKSDFEKIENKNIIYFPMYDHVSTWRPVQWENCKNVKIISFSKKLYNTLVKWGFSVTYLQFFIEPKEFFGGDVNKIFFWQRHKKINFKTVLRLFGQEKVSVHIHKSTDPGQQYIAPTSKQEERYNISYSDWFDSKEDFLNCIADKGIFIAPRYEEGIGMSFLEAMAMGKVVVAHNQPTMNEYIVNGKTGILRNFKFPINIKINKDKFEKIQKETYQYCVEGYQKWLVQRAEIISIINSSIPDNKLSVSYQFAKLLTIIDRRDVIRMKLGHNASLTLFGKLIFGKQ